MVTPLGKAIQFFQDFGLFDVVLPFLLVFTIVFAILEKTKLLGTVKVGKETIANKNLDAMVAFVIGLLVVATANIVGTINEALPKIILLLVVVFSFLLLLGIFWKTEEKEFLDRHKKAYNLLLVLILIGVILIFLDSIYSEDKSWLNIIINYIATKWSGAVFGSIIILIVVVLAIYFITKGSKEEKKEGG